MPTTERRATFERVLRLDPRRTALLVIDMQRGFLDPGEVMAVPPARAVVPRIGSITSFETVLRETDRDQMVIATEPAVASAAVLLAPERPQAALVLVGPEGGWSREEIERALLEGARPRQLGPRTLRAESAPIVLLSALSTEWGWT